MRYRDAKQNDDEVQMAKQNVMISSISRNAIIDQFLVTACLGMSLLAVYLDFRLVSLCSLANYAFSQVNLEITAENEKGYSSQHGITASSRSCEYYFNRTVKFMTRC